MPFADAQPDQPLQDDIRNPTVTTPFALHDYFTLVDWAGRAVRDDKRGAIPAHVPKLMAQLGLEQGGWVVHMKRLGKYSRLKIGAEGRSVSVNA